MVLNLKFLHKGDLAILCHVNPCQPHDSSDQAFALDKKNFLEKQEMRIMICLDKFAILKTRYDPINKNNHALI